MKDYKICLLGDFNARTGVKDDFINVNDYVCNAVQLDNVTKQEYDLVNLDLLGIDCKRYNLDKSVNNYGNRLLQLCQNLNLLIANGRLGKDRDIGSLTCKESSTVDYCILSPVLSSCVANFEICSFDCLISDVHNALHLELLRKNVTSVENDDNVTNVHAKKIKMGQ